MNFKIPFRYTQQSGDRECTCRSRCGKHSVMSTILSIAIGAQRVPAEDENIPCDHRHAHCQHQISELRNYKHTRSTSAKSNKQGSHFCGCELAHLLQQRGLELGARVVQQRTDVRGDSAALAQPYPVRNRTHRIAHAADGRAHQARQHKTSGYRVRIRQMRRQLCF